VRMSDCGLRIDSAIRNLRSALCERQYLRLYWPGHGGIARRDDHIDFRSNAEILEVDARLDGKTGAGEQPPIVVRFVVVHVDAVAVNRFAQAVPGPVQDLRAVSGVA